MFKNHPLPSHLFLDVRQPHQGAKNITKTSFSFSKTSLYHCIQPPTIFKACKGAVEIWWHLRHEVKLEGGDRKAFKACDDIPGNRRKHTNKAKKRWLPSQLPCPANKGKGMDGADPFQLKSLESSQNPRANHTTLCPPEVSSHQTTKTTIYSKT